jgi:hypothetical protein
LPDVSVRQAVITTSRSVRNAYWDLAYSIASLAVQQQSLTLAETSLRNTRARVEIGTTPPIDVIEAEAEVATREEAVIIAEAQIESAQDVLRALVYNPSMPDFWAIRLEPADVPAFEAMPVDVDRAARNALERRTDLEQARKNLETTDINVRFFRNETLPDVTASFDYGLIGLGGTQFVRGAGFPAPSSGSSSAALAACWVTSLPTTFQLDRLHQRHVSDRRNPAPGQPCPNTAPIQPGTDAASQPGAAGRDAGSRGRPPGANQPEARGHDAHVSAARGTASRRRGTEIRGGNVHQLLRVSGAARFGAGPQQRAACCSRLQPVDRGFRGCAGGSSQVACGAALYGPPFIYAEGFGHHHHPQRSRAHRRRHRQRGLGR